MPVWQPVAGDPFEGVLSFGPRVPLSLVLAFALVLHAGGAAAAGAAMMFADIFYWGHSIRGAVEAKLSQTYDIEVKAPEPEPPPPPPEPVKEEPKDEPKPEPKAVVKETPKADSPPPPPAAAEAAKVLTQEPPKDEPVDLTGNTFVTGSGSTYAGGTTQTGGTSKTAVYNTAAAATGAPGGTGTAPAPAAPRIDRSRTCELAERAWECPFPPESDAEQIDRSAAIVQIKVRPDGTAESATVVQDPGHGFGREARKCAMRKRYVPALDVDGRPTTCTKTVRVNFDR